MSVTFRLRSLQRLNRFGQEESLYFLESDAAGIAVRPDHGFNCYRWWVKRDGTTHEILYSAPDFFEDIRPTRSGFPILFPFPNRIRHGRMTWAGQDYQLPLNDATGVNAIHGFACRYPWRVLDYHADADSAWIRGEFQASKDGFNTRRLWPGDYRLQIRFVISADSLRVEALAHNPDDHPVPFGLGYHQFFSIPFLGDDNPMIQIPAKAIWELEHNLPTGLVAPVDEVRNLRQGKPFQELQLDDVYTKLNPSTGTWTYLGGVLGKSGSLKMYGSPSFREVVAFTPPHRNAVCLEPYTCTTDAVNLQAHKVDAGWETMGPGGNWSALVEMRLS